MYSYKHNYLFIFLCFHFLFSFSLPVSPLFILTCLCVFQAVGAGIWAMLLATWDPASLTMRPWSWFCILILFSYIIYFRCTKFKHFRIRRTYPWLLLHNNVIFVVIGTIINIFIICNIDNDYLYLLVTHNHTLRDLHAFCI